MSGKKRVIRKTLEEAIMESADWSGSTQICMKCTQGDLESVLMPILQKLTKLRRNSSVNEAREQLVKFLKDGQIVQERVFTEHISKAAIALYRLASEKVGNKHSDSVHEFLKKNLEPIAAVLEKAISPRVRRLGKKLRRAYENRYSPPTKEEKARNRLEMLRLGMIPYKKMTKAEKAEYDRQMMEQRQERRRERDQAERVLGIHRSRW
jgi:hypothetical protein